MIRLEIRPLLAALLALLTGSCVMAGPDSDHVPEDPNLDLFTTIAWRSIGSYSNREPFKELKVRCFAGTEGIDAMLDTGQAYQGWHELHPKPGLVTAGFSDKQQSYPAIVSGIVTKHERCAVFDVLMDYVYEADCYVTTPTVDEIGQTFVATNNELVQVSCHVASGFDDFDVTIREGGPKGRQIGPKSSFNSGFSIEWGVARWEPGEVPLTPGKTYYIGITPRSGKPMSVYAHSVGNVYDGGCAYYDGIPEPLTDIGLYITEDKDQMTRSIIDDVDEEGWVKSVRGVYFTARSSNVRAIFTSLRFPDQITTVQNFIHFYKVGDDGGLIPFGPVKHGWRINHRNNATHSVGALYNEDEVPLEMGKKYFVEVVPASEDWGVPESQIPARDYSIRIYGEKIAGMTPAIYNQHIWQTTPNAVKLGWEGSTDCHTVIRYGDDPYNLDQTIELRPGCQEAVIDDLEPGSAVNFRFELTSDQGGTFRTPIYQAKTLLKNGNVDEQIELWKAPQHRFLSPPCIGFLNLAKLDYIRQMKLPDTEGKKQANVTNPSFDDGLDGWELLSAVDIKQQKQPNGAAAGWGLAFQEVKDSKVEEVIYQKVKVIPGKTYALLASLYTYQNGHQTDWYFRPGSRLQGGDLRARMVCDPTGGTDFDGRHSTQWLRTDGRWLRFAKQWKAESDTMTVGVSFYRERDWTTMLALADNIQLVQLD